MQTQQTFLETPIEYLKGVGPVRAELLKKELSVFTFGDLLLHFPFRYVDKSKFTKVSEVISDQLYIQVRGKLGPFRKAGTGRAIRVMADLSDETGKIELIWFQGHRWIMEKLIPGKEYIIFGKPVEFKGKFNIPHPETEEVTGEVIAPRDKLQPVYSTTEKLRSRGLDSKAIGKLVKTLVSQISGHISESLSETVLARIRLMAREEAFRHIHFPQDTVNLERAQLRLKFEELFFLQLNMLLSRQIRLYKLEGYTFPVIGNYLNTFYKEHLPFELTNAQKKVIKEIRADLGSGRQMNRLLQGDVGSGKTLVALMCMLIALDNGFQACLMAPTEILANQHYKTISRMVAGLGIKVALLTGSTKKADRKLIHQQLANGEMQILTGTHALIEDTVEFMKLGLVVIDEQHRFGVAQRASFRKKSDIPPHILVMTATPIPRTLAMTMYGDLDLSVIDELPPGRTPILTRHFTDANRLRVFGFMRSQIHEGRQVYVVFPLIHESEKLDLKFLMDGFEAISREFPLPRYAISMVHGQLSSQDKEYEMQRFVKGETQIMVSTTVIEVGVDVPNASVMVIENAERFGLPQLHQLRGRVGRGAAKSYCILMTADDISYQAKKRIRVMLETTDGFKIAEADLEIRGPGDIQGTQQSGLLNFRIADLAQDEQVLRLARNVAEEILKNDPLLDLPSNAILKRNMGSMSGNKPFWSLVG